MTPKFKDKTRGGFPVRIYATEGGGVYPIHGAIKDGDNGWMATTWTLAGTVRFDGAPRSYDLIPLREPSEEGVKAAYKAYAAWSSAQTPYRGSGLNQPMTDPYAAVRAALRAAYEIDGIGGGE